MLIFTKFELPFATMDLKGKMGIITRYLHIFFFIAYSFLFASSCDSGDYNDRDDLVFAVADAVTAPPVTPNPSKSPTKKASRSFMDSHASKEPNSH